MSATIKDIADELGISMATVSNVLNRKGRVGDQTIQKVHEVARKLNYNRNELASRLASKRSMTIGVFIFDSYSTFDSEVHVAYRAIRVYLNQLRKKKFDLLLFSMDNFNDEHDILDICTGRLVEGVVVLWPENEKIIRKLLHSPLPTVIVERHYHGKYTASVHFDNNRGVTLALEHLLCLGHRDIGFVKEIDYSDVAMERYRAFVEQMKQKKQILHKDFIYEAHFTLQDGWNVGNRIAKDIVEDKRHPSAIITSADLLAIGMIRAFEEHGLRVPEDISIIGYDGFMLGQFMHKKLTSVRQDFSKMAMRTIEMLFIMIEEGKEVENEIISTELIVGETTTALSQ